MKFRIQRKAEAESKTLETLDSGVGQLSGLLSQENPKQSKGGKFCLAKFNSLRWRDGGDRDDKKDGGCVCPTLE